MPLLSERRSLWSMYDYSATLGKVHTMMTALTGGHGMWTPYCCCREGMAFGLFTVHSYTEGTSWGRE